MKLKIMLIGLALLLMLCISPVAAVSGTDFEEVISKVDGVNTYKYLNLNDPDEEYTAISYVGTACLISFVTFRAANIPDAPAMLARTNCRGIIYLPRSVDEWEIKYYSRFWHEPNICKEHLKNSGVVNLNKEFGKYIDNWLHLELSTGQCIYPRELMWPWPRWSIPSV